MPCYISIRIYQEEFDNLPAMREAAKALGLRIEERGGEIWIGGSVKAKKRGNKYQLSTENNSILKSLMDEYAAAKIAKKARQKNMIVKKEKASNGEITLKVYQS